MCSLASAKAWLMTGTRCSSATFMSTSVSGADVMNPMPNGRSVLLPDTLDLLAQPLRTLQARADHSETTGGGDGRSEGGVGTARHRRADDRVLDPEQVTESRMQHRILLARVVATVTAHNTTAMLVPCGLKIECCVPV